MLRPRLLRSFGWNAVLFLTKNWFDNPDGALESPEQRIRAGTR